MSSLGERLRELRRVRKLTQLELASGLVTPSMISQIELNRIMPSPQLLHKLAKKLQVDTGYFADELTQKTEEMAAFRKAKTLLDIGQYETALPLLQWLQEHFADDFRGHQLFEDLAVCYEKLGRWGEAAESQLAVAQLACEREDYANYVRALSTAAQLYRKLSKPTMAEKYLEQAQLVFSRHPELTMPLYMRICTVLGQLYVEQERYSLAVDEFQRAIAMALQNHHQMERAVMEHWMGKAQAGLQNWKEAMLAFDAAVIIYRQNGQQRRLLAVQLDIAAAFRKMMFYDEALAILAFEFPNVSAEFETIVHQEKALCYLRNGDLEKALCHARTSRAMKTVDIPLMVHSWLIEARVADLLHEKSEMQECLAQISRILDMPIADTGIPSAIRWDYLQAKWHALVTHLDEVTNIPLVLDQIADVISDDIISGVIR